MVTAVGDADVVDEAGVPPHETMAAIARTISALRTPEDTELSYWSGPGGIPNITIGPTVTIV
ncbi:MAG: hypothetical protein AUG05_05445 [Actinobacteria bacterium 13_1_20CM_2_66_18]|nr:MAG: hypothetical protein AUG05_05445 [Actinobacteria bacterium 13_1_20CM_2_66_18]